MNIKKYFKVSKQGDIDIKANDIKLDSHECTCKVCNCDKSIPPTSDEEHAEELRMVAKAFEELDKKETIKIKYFEGATELEINPKGNLIDAYARKDVFVPYMGYAMIPLGFAMELPKGKKANLMPRSSTFKNWGVIQTNHIGQIDETYCGDNDEWNLPVQCTIAKETIKTEVEGHKITMMGTWIRQGDKICQFEIVDAMVMPSFEKVEILGNEDRGGFGSSGTKKVLWKI